LPPFRITREIKSILLVIRNYQQGEIAADSAWRALEGKKLNPDALAGHRDDSVNIHDANYCQRFRFSCQERLRVVSRGELLALFAGGGRRGHARVGDPDNVAPQLL
jgi:hypothetical protein